MSRCSVPSGLWSRLRGESFLCRKSRREDPQKVKVQCKSASCTVQPGQLHFLSLLLQELGAAGDPEGAVRSGETGPSADGGNHPAVPDVRQTSAPGVLSGQRGRIQLQLSHPPQPELVLTKPANMNNRWPPSVHFPLNKNETKIYQRSHWSWCRYLESVQWSLGVEPQY